MMWPWHRLLLPFSVYIVFILYTKTATITDIPILDDSWEGVVKFNRGRTGDSTPTVHLLSGLQGNTTTFIDQWEVNFKSSLLNAPHNGPLHIHIVANGFAVEAVQRRILLSGLLDHKCFAHPVSLTVYNVDDVEEDWKQFVRLHLGGKILDNEVSGHHPFGAYYRLLAYKAILPHFEEKRMGNEPNAMNPIIYMDTDVVVLANLFDVWRHVDTTGTSNYAYQWSGTWPCSGFMVLYLQRMEQWWELLRTVKIPGSNTNDQNLLRAAGEANPTIQGILPKEWDVHMGHGWRKAPQELIHQKRVGMVHFTGKPPTGDSFYDLDSVGKYCRRGPDCKDSKAKLALYMQTWGLIEYYVRIPWHLLRYIAESGIPDGQIKHGLQLEIVRVQ